MEKFKLAMKMIEEANTICITTHIRPDGDAIGSAFSLLLALQNMGKNVRVVMSSFSKKFEFLEEVKTSVENVCEAEYDLLICTDSSDKKRLDISEKDFAKAQHVLVFDHHKLSSIPAELSIVDEKAPAVCECVYKFLKANDVNITSKIADYLYMGLMTDTGSFNYDRTTAETYEIAAALIKQGARFALICKNINDSIPESKARLIAYSLDNMQVYYGGKLRISVADNEVLNRLGVDKEDAEGITNYLRMVEGTELAVYIRGIENSKFKASLRSVNFVDCAALAKEFGGGGHIRAAGFDLENLEETIKKIVEKTREGLDVEDNRNT